MEIMNEANLNMFWAIDEYLTYKMSRYFDTYILLLGLKDDSGFFMNFEGGRGGIEGHLYKKKVQRYLLLLTTITRSYVTMTPNGSLI